MPGVEDRSLALAGRKECCSKYTMIEKISLAEKLSSFDDHWSPKIVGEVNDCHVKLVKLEGEFVWHQHETEDEMFLVVKGRLRMKLRDGSVDVNEGEFIIIPHGVDHLPVADQEAHVLLFEPKTTVRTGDPRGERPDASRSIE